MIRVPASWTCASHTTAFVEREDGCTYLCRVVRSQPTATVHEAVFQLPVEPDAVRRLTRQDCTAPETVWVTAVPRPSSSTAPQTLFFTHVEEPTELDDKEVSDARVERLRIACPLRVKVATSLTLAGPRFDARATPSELGAVLSGRCVAVGTSVAACGATYRVVALEAHHGQGGVALVGGDCRVRLNDTTMARKALADSSAFLIGLDKERERLRGVFAVARGSPGQAFGVLVHGPKGCGVRSLAEAALQEAALAEGSCTVIVWTPSLDVALTRHRTRSRVLAFLIPHCERFFCVDGEDGDETAAALTARILQTHVHALTQQALANRGAPQLAVVVLALTHVPGAVRAGAGLGSPLDALMSVDITVSLPGAEERAALLSATRRRPVATCMEEAHSLVGRSRAEVLAAGLQRSVAYRPPFKPVRWADIGGLEEVKTRLHKALVWPQQHPEAFARFGLNPPKGILLYGPPGCAKTTLVKALCSEGYFSLIYLDSATVVSAYVGESERQLREVFARAAQQAPCIVFFDEMEVIGARRAAGDGGKDAENVRLLSTLLTEMDGFTAAKGVCFVGATNVPHLIDDALLRPGRFDYLVHVPLPDQADRERILSLFLQKTATSVPAVALATEGFSGADLSALCSTALLSMEGADAAQPPQRLSDRDWMTAYLLEQVRCFKRTDYDAKALQRFQQQHTTSVL